MDGLHECAESAEGQLGYTGSGSLKNDGKCAELESDNTTEDRCKDDLETVRRIDTLGGEHIALHDRTINQEVTDKATVECHVPAVCTECHKSTVGEEQALNCEDDDHGQETGPWS